MVDRGIGQPVEHLHRVVVMQPDIADARRFDARQQLRHRIDEGLDADEAGAGMGPGPVDQVLAAAEADFEPDRGHG